MPFRNGQNGYTSHFQHNIAFITDKNTISMEELYILNPDVILLGNEDAYKEVMNSSLWKNLDAVKNGKVYLVPSEPYSFIDNPPATNRLIGIYWLGNLLYPELYPVDIIEKTQEYYSLFYRYDLSREQAESILRYDNL